MKRLLQALALAVLVLAPTSLLAQDVLPRPLNSQEDLKLTGVGDGVVANWASVYIGPYGGAITSGNPTIPQLTLYCVDYAHDVSVGQSWHVNVSNIGGGSPDLSNTYLGQTFAGDLNNVVKYREAAYLASLFSSWSDYVGSSYSGGTFGSKRAVYSGIHAAIWRITSQNQTGYEFPGDFPSYGMNASLATSMSQPFFDMATNMGNQGFTGIDPSFFGQWSVLSDVNGTGQEYLVRTTVTPEPETYVMLLTGLLMLFGVTWWRRRNDAASLA